MLFGVGQSDEDMDIGHSLFALFVALPRHRQSIQFCLPSVRDESPFAAARPRFRTVSPRICESEVNSRFVANGMNLNGERSIVLCDTFESRRALLSVAIFAVEHSVKFRPNVPASD